jgi:hypothetical protein
MSETVQQVDYFAVTVPDQTGEGHRILAALAAAGVDLRAVCGFPVGEGKAQMDFVPADPKAFSEAAAQLKLRVRKPKRAFLVTGDDRVGAVASVLSRLAQEKIPVTAAQAVAAGNGRWGMILWVKPARVQKAARALGAA